MKFKVGILKTSFDIFVLFCSSPKKLQPLLWPSTTAQIVRRFALTRPFLAGQIQERFEHRDRLISMGQTDF